MSKRYLRFGDIPTNERSINWYKVKLDDQSDFSWALKAYGIEDAYRMIRNLDDVFEPGVSVFAMGEDNEPVLDNDELIKSYNFRKKDKSKKCYVVTGDEVGIGCDGEPLIVNVKIIEQLR